MSLIDSVIESILIDFSSGTLKLKLKIESGLYEADFKNVKEFDQVLREYIEEDGLEVGKDTLILVIHTGKSFTVYPEYLSILNAHLKNQINIE